MRQCLVALPIRSWNSDDSNSLASCATGDDVVGKNGASKRARLCRDACVDDTASAFIATPTIPIIISSPDDCSSERVTAHSSVELLSTQRRSSCPFSACDMAEETSTLSSRRNSLSSRKRKHDLSPRRPSLQSVVASTCHLAIDEEPERYPTGDGGDEQKHERREMQSAAAAAAAGRANGECRSSSLDVHWTTRRLSLPHSSSSLTTH